MAYTNINGIQIYVDIFSSLLDGSSSRHIQIKAESRDTILSTPHALQDDTGADGLFLPSLTTLTS